MTTVLTFAVISLFGCAPEAEPPAGWTGPQDTGVPAQPSIPGGDTDPETDSDGDGLTDLEEEALGTNSDDTDSDDDGFSDGEEVLAETNPGYRYSHPYEGGYNVGYCNNIPAPTGPTGVASSGAPGYKRGDVVENYTMLDQHGEEVDLYSFCDRTVMIAIGYINCSPCGTLARELQGLQDRYGDQGFQAIEVLFPSGRDYNEPVTPTDTLVMWADEHGLENIPVLGDTARRDFSLLFEKTSSFPTTVILGPDMTVLSVDQGVRSPEGYL